MEPTIPWYRSPVYVSVVTSLISQLLALAGRSDLFPTEQVNAFVEGVFQIIAIVAVVVAEWKRRKSAVQPITLTKASKQAGFAKVALMAILALGAVVTASSLSGCAALGLQQPETFSERLAYAYTTHTAIQNAAAASLDAKEITRADALQVLKLADESRTVLDAARMASDAGDPRTAEGRLALATSILLQVQTYLRNRGEGA